MSKTRQDALDRLVKRAQACRSSAIVRVSVNHEFLAMGKGCLNMIVATGTAVTLHKSSSKN
ncbi:heavy metal-binding domain-containing protein (plasmid) [Methylomonas sp. MED-D]|uniref:heavy metal-binding domain-containing protein n=1 Tax=Methylomonas sp. MED-D TaxID=3418768 RepID=UPI003D0400D0